MARIDMDWNLKKSEFYYNAYKNPPPPPLNYHGYEHFVDGYRFPIYIHEKETGLGEQLEL